LRAFLRGECLLAVEKEGRNWAEEIDEVEEVEEVKEKRERGG